MAAGTLNFAAQIDEWVKATKARQTAVFRTAVEDLDDMVLAATPVVDGFLKNTRERKINAPLSVADKQPGSAPTVVVMTIADLEIGDFVTIGFSAVYGPRVHYGFVGQDKLGRNINQAPNPWIAIQATKWPQIVTAAAAKAKASVKSKT